MKEYQSLRKKLLLTLVPPLLLLILVASSILFRFAVVEQRDAFDDALYDSAHSIYQLLSKSESSIQKFSLPKIEKQFILNDKSDVIFYNIVDTQGNILNGEKKLNLSQEIINQKSNPNFSDGVINNLPVRIVTTLVKVEKDGEEIPVYIQVAETLNKREALAGQVLLDIIVPQLLLVYSRSLLFGLALSGD